MKRDRAPISVRIKQLFQFASGYRKVDMIPRTEREKQIIRNTICWTVPCFIVLGLLVCYYHSILIKNLEIIITGIVTIATTYFIVHQSKKVDYHRERLENLPIIDLVIYKSSNNDEIDDYMDCLEEGNEHHSILEITNIGKGIAFNVEAYGLDNEFEVLGYEPEKARLETIKVNGNKLIELNCNCDDSSSFILRLNYNDLFENQYNQDFIIKYRDKDLIQRIESNAPILVRRTRRFRYIQ